MEKLVFSRKYRVDEEIARGGMGIVYRGTDLKLNCPIAIKVLHAHLSGDDSFAKRFIQEAQRMARLAHDNIVRVHALDEEDGKSYIVMEYFPGPTLRALLRKHGRLPVRQAVGIALQLARALEYAHAQGIIHRDIKPANIMVGADGKAKLVDFGIAAALDESSLTATGQVIGTPEYMAPEQARGEAVGRSDLYSLGIVLYEMLVGHTPFHGVAKTAILGKLMHDGDEIALDFPADIPPMLQDMVHALVRKDPSARTPDAATLARQLTKLIQAIHVSPDSDDEPTVEVPAAPPFDSGEGTPDDGRDSMIEAGQGQHPAGLEETDIVSPPQQGNVRPPERRSSERTKRLWLIGGTLAGAVLIVAVVSLWPRPPLPPPPPTPPNGNQDQTLDSRRAALDQLLQRFAVAYEHRDLPSIRQMSDMSDSRLTTVRLMFDNYATIKAHVDEVVVTGDGANAVLVITDLIDTKGRHVPPDPILQRTKLQVKREGDQWTKVVW